MDDTNPHLEAYLNIVPKGILNASVQCSLTLNADDVSWLHEHNGRFKQFVNPGSNQAKKLVNTKKLSGIPLLDAAATIEREMHKILGESPRCTGVADNTEANYEQSLKQMWNFLAIVGDYESMLILLSKPPPNCPSMSRDRIVQYVHHRFAEPLTPLTKDGTSHGDRVKCALGNSMSSEGSVQNCRWLDSIFASLAEVHLCNDRNGQYEEQCLHCNTAKDFCPTHKEKKVYTKIQNRGDPTSSPQVKKVKKWLKSETVARGYSPDHKSPFLPGDITTMHKAVTASQFDIWNFQNYLVILDAVEHGCRFDSMGRIEVATFEVCQEHWVLKNGVITNIAQRVREKTDKRDYDYRIHFQDYIPQRCLARHLLVFVHCLNILEGYLFLDKPDLEDVHKLAKDGCERQNTQDRNPLDYTKFGNWIAQVATKMDEPHLANFGPHSPRGTKYLMNYLGGAHFAQAAKTSRHSSLETAQSYFDDAACMQSLIADHPELLMKHAVPPFQDHMIGGNGNNCKRVAAGINGRTKGVTTLVDMAKIFVTQMLNVSEDSPLYRDPAHLLQLSYRMRFDPEHKQSTGNIHLEAIKRVPVEFRNQLLTSFHIFQKEKDAKRMPNAQHHIRAQKGPSLSSGGGRPTPLVASIQDNSDEKLVEHLPAMSMLVRVPGVSGNGHNARIDHSKLKEMWRRCKDGKVDMVISLVGEVADLAIAMDQGNCAKGIIERLAIGIDYMSENRENKKKMKDLHRKTLRPFSQCYHVCHGANLTSFMVVYGGHTSNFSQFYTLHLCERCKANTSTSASTPPKKKKRKKSAITPAK